jgi:hypothetical protein
MRRAALLAAAVGGGCTFAPGAAFTRVEGGTLDVVWEPGARAVDGATFLTAGGLAVTVEQLSLDVEALTLLELEGADDVTFDPANPPPGYTFCHADHCHREDGALISYAEIRAELAGGDATFTELLTFGLDATADLRSPTRLALGAPAPGPDLGLVTLTQAALSLGAFSLEGLAAPWAGAGDALPAERPDARPVRVALSLGAPLTRGLGLEVSRTGPAVQRVEAVVTVDATFLDGLSPADLPADGALALTDLADPRAAAVRDAVLLSTLEAGLAPAGGAE